MSTPAPRPKGAITMVTQFWVGCGHCAATRTFPRPERANTEQIVRGLGWDRTAQGWTCPACLALHYPEKRVNRRVTLTAPEATVLAGLREGRSLAQLAQDLGVSDSRVAALRDNAFRRLYRAERDGRTKPEQLGDLAWARSHPRWKHVTAGAA